MNNSNLIILVDDDDIIQRFFQIALTPDGYTVLIANNHEELNSILATENPDLMLIDKNLGSEDGGLLCQELKSDHAYKDIPIILISGAPLSVEDYQAYEADGFISKPMDLTSLKSKIKEYLIN